MNQNWKTTFLKQLPLLILGVLLILYTQLLLTYMVPVTGGTDQNGYHVCARMLNLKGVCYQKPVDDLQFIGHMWVVNERGEYYPKYPPFYPAVAAGMNWLLGEGGGFYATVWGAVLAVGGMFVLGRFWAGGWWGLLAAGMMALSPVVAILGIAKNSHTPSLAFFLWGMAAVVSASRCRSRTALFRAVLGGALIGFTVGIRYTDFLLIFIPLAYGLFLIPGRRKWSLTLAVCLGAAIPYAALAWFHTQAYGAPWRSGYSLTSESSAFEWRFIPANFLIYVPEFFTGVIGPLGVFALAVWRLRWRRAVFWSIWILPTFVLYLMYYWAPDGEGTGAMRFLCPLIPAVILLTILSLRRLRTKILPYRGAFFCSLTLLLLLQGTWGWARITKMGEPKAAGDLQKAVVVESARQHIPEGAVLIANAGLLNELDFEKRWHLYPSYIMNPREIRNIVKRSLDSQAAGLQQSRARALDKQLGAFNYGQLYKYLREFFERQQKEGHPVYFLGRGWEVNQFQRVFYRYFETEKAGGITGTRPAWLLRELKRDASRYRPRKEPVPLTSYEIIRLGPKREKVLPIADSRNLLQSERREILNRINPENDQLLQSDLTRLETIRDDLAALRRAAQDAKRREEARRKAAEKRKARQKLLRKISEASRRMAAENSANRARMEKQRKAEEEARRKAEVSLSQPRPTMK